MTTRTYLAAFLLIPASAFADFSYTETSKMTGGALMNMSRSLGAFSKSMRQVGEPTTHTTALSGNRMASIHSSYADIWDLDKETITHIDFEKKTYATMTFAQMREAMEKAMQRMQTEMKKAEGKRAEAEAKQKEANVEMNVRVEAKDTGKTQSIAGLNTHEVLLITGLEAKDKKTGNSAGEMQTVMSVWLTDSVPGYKEVEDFYKRMAMKMAANMPPGMMTRGMQVGMDPRFQANMANLAKEAEKLKGVHIRTVTKMGANLDLETAGQITDPSTQPQGPDAKKAAGNAAGGAAGNEAEKQSLGRLASRLPGGFGGLGRRKKDEGVQQPPAQQQQSQQEQQSAQNAVMMEMVSEKGNFSTAPVDGSKFAVPSGFKQVEHPMMKALQQ